jgi:cytochrome c oxidase subunit II
MERQIAVLVSAVLGITLLVVFATVARRAGSTGSADAIAADTARWRRVLFWSLVVAFVPAIAYSLTKLPYSSGGGEAAVVVNATGHQWAWELAPASVPVGKVVEIRVTGADVNHGFALYDARDRLLAQTQAMPGYTNILHYTFTAPGAYTVRCLEYCGLGHHTMMAPFTVTAGN